MLKQKNYDFALIFDKVAEAEQNYDIINKNDMEVSRQVDEDIKALNEISVLLQQPECYTYTQS